MIIIKNWPGGGAHFVQMQTAEEQEMCKSSTDLFKILNEKFKPEHNETILSLQYCKLLRMMTEMLKSGWAT